ncbi:DUF4442 domain-containing protein [Psychroserpens sp.]|uniref:DUF4442 domain-containing protein n=1 Tax=Psychroserpens sp. TaxID=2020870 RepID=UPI0038593483
MTISPRKLNAFLLIKLPAAYFCGVRTKALSDTTCEVSVKHRWINQNPFNSMFWAVQGMAAELTTGALVMSKVKSSGIKMSMLVTNNDAKFTKKATGRIKFTCNQGTLIDDAISKAIETSEGQTILLNSKGVNNEGLQVSDFNFEWSIKVKH